MISRTRIIFINLHHLDTKRQYYIGTSFRGRYNIFILVVNNLMNYS